MPKDKSPPRDHNDPGDAEMKRLIAHHTDNYLTLVDQRASVNAKINSERKAIKALGNIDMDAWRASLRRKQMDPDVRAEFDRSQELCNEALGVPIQADLFGDNDDQAGENPIPDAA